ncbi:uncharacterized protein [Amphiura filiformis]|uniref:uncharacterized protein n=1 Tax=Amphiura filiformis TaxID=82378 RepID=UPI003B20C487
MGRNSAENQRRYREKKKQDPDWRQKESKRVQKYYISTPKLSAKEVEKRREKGRISMRKTRLKRKAEMKAPDSTSKRSRPTNAMVGRTLPSSGPLTRGMVKEFGADNFNGQDMPGPSSRSTEILTIKMPFNTKDHSCKRINRSVMRAKRKNQKVIKERDKLQKRVWCLEKRLRRISSPNIDPSRPTTKPSKPLATPVKRAINLLRQSGISPRKAPAGRNALVLHNSIMREVKKSGKKVCREILVSAELKRSRCQRLLAKSWELNRGKGQKKVQIRSRKVKAQLRRRRVVAFLKREDNSSCLPGKRDAQKVDDQLVQKYILSDTLANLHKKFKLENPITTISFASFAKYRPKI